MKAECDQRTMSIEEMESYRSQLYKDYLKAIGTPEEPKIVEKLRIVDESIDAINEYDEEDEDLRSSTNWDEWNIDNKIDRMREEEQ